MTVARALEAVLGPDLPIAVRAYDRSRLGAADAPATLLVRSPAVFRRLVTAPGELGLGRAYVSGELDVEGDLWGRLYMAASALNFEAGRTQVHQVLAVRPDRGRSGLPLRPRFEDPSER